MKRFPSWAWACVTAAALAAEPVAAVAAQAPAAPAPTAAARPNFEGIWQVTRAYSVQARTPPIDGGPIPFLQWTKAIWDAAIRDEKAGDPWIPNNQRCLVAGFVRAVKGNFPFRVVQTDQQVIFLFEEDGRVNQVPLRAAHKNLQPTWYGDPIARWDGDTLVVDTVGFNGKTPFIQAIHHTADLHTVQRIRLINEGKQLEIRVTIDDPGAFSRPWDTLLVFNRAPAGYKLRDYRCAENNRDLATTGMWGPD